MKPFQPVKSVKGIEVIADSLNGYIVSESEDESSPSVNQNVSSPVDPRLHDAILK